MAGFSVVVDDFDVGGIRAQPAETQAESVVDANAVLAFAVAAQRFEAVAWRDAQVVEAPGPVELFQFAPGDGFDAVEASHPVPLE